MRNKIAIGLIVLGVLVAAYPLADTIYGIYWEKRLLAQFEDQIALGIGVEDVVASDYIALDEIFVEGEPEEFETESEAYPVVEEFTVPEIELPSENATTEPETTPPTTAAPAPKWDIIGKLIIPKIEVEMALLKGATDLNLSRGAATIEGTSQIGEIGNAGIAGHRGRTYGRKLNRLDELEIGDLIEIQTASENYKFRVYKTHIVEPTDVSVLYRNDTDRIITLVTCDPVINPTHRLIVHAVLEP